MSSPAIVDAVADRNRQVLYKIARLVDLPDFVREAPPIDSATVEKLPASVFAADGKFPCHTKAATWLAQLYFLENRHLYPSARAERIQEKIARAADYWGIGEQIKQAAAAWETRSTTGRDLTDDDYAIVVDYDDRRLRRFPINNAVNVKAAAASLYRFRGRFPYDWRRVAARRILHKAAEYEVTDIEPEVREYLTKAASYGSTAPKLAAEAIARRMLMLPSGRMEVKIAAAKLAKAVAGMKGIPPAAEMIKLARIVDRLDREEGLYRHYDDGVEMPEEIFFQLTEKKAAAFRDGHFQLATGTIIPFEALVDIPLNKVASAVGEEFVKAVLPATSPDIDLEEFARVASSLPRDEAQLLERALAAAGMKFETPTLEAVALRPCVRG